MIDPYSLEELASFPSIMDAANYVHVSDSAIRKYLKGNLNICGGYFWKRKNEDKVFTPLKENQKINTKNVAKIVQQYTLDHQLIAEYSSIGQANKAMGKSRSNQRIPEACKNHTEIFGFLWEFKE